MVPVNAVKTDKDGSSYVMVMRNGQPQKQIVEAGLKNRVDIQIKSGLNEGDKIVSNPSAAVTKNYRRGPPGFL